MVPFLTPFDVDEKVFEVVESEAVPGIGEVSRGSEEKDHLEVFVILIVGLVGLSHEAYPHSPFVLKQFVFQHLL